MLFRSLPTVILGNVRGLAFPETAVLLKRGHYLVPSAPPPSWRQMEEVGQMCRSDDYVVTRKVYIGKFGLKAPRCDQTVYRIQHCELPPSNVSASCRSYGYVTFMLKVSPLTRKTFFPFMTNTFAASVNILFSSSVRPVYSSLNSSAPKLCGVCPR